MLQFTLHGTVYTFDQNRLAVDEAIDIKNAAGITIRQFLQGMNVLDPVALKAMVWLAYRRAGQDPAYDDIAFDALDFLDGLRTVNDAGEEVTSEGIPTMPESPTSDSANGITPPTAEPATSDRSLSTSA